MSIPRHKTRPFSIANTAIALCSFLLVQTAAHAAPRVEDLLQAMAQADRTISYSATETTTHTGGATVVASLKKNGTKKILQYSAPAIMRGDVLVDNGQSLLRYHRAEKAAIRTKTATTQSRPSWDKLKTRLNATTQGPVTLNGRKAWLLTLTSRQSKRTMRKMWVDDATKIRLKAELFNENGTLRETTTLSGIQFVKVSDSVFNWSPPAGTKITHAGTLYTQLRRAQREAAWLRAPSRVPAGYSFESAVVNSADAWLRYSNGTRRFSVFQQRISNNQTTSLRRAGAGWFWQKNGSRFLIVGLNANQAAAVAAAVS